MLLQMDGSPHDWLEGRGPRLTLLIAIDDATNEVPNGVFREQEDDAGYFLLVQMTRRGSMMILRATEVTYGTRSHRATAGEVA
jgi:hypothetical protein